jgi:hypothetical protein
MGWNRPKALGARPGPAAKSAQGASTDVRVKHGHHARAQGSVVECLPVAHRPVMEEAACGESRRGPKEMCQARQAWLTKKLQCRWGGGEAPGGSVLPDDGAPIGWRSIPGSLQHKSDEGEVRG